MKYAPAPVAAMTGPSRSQALNFALDMVSGMAESDQIALPAKPTPAMLAAGARAGSVTVITVWKIYRAMVGAA